MFPPRYFARRFYPRRYFGVGATIVFLPWLTMRCNQLLGPSAPEPKQ